MAFHITEANNALVHITELIQLQDVGISLDQVTWCRVTLTSDNWICVRHTSKGKNHKNCKYRHQCLVTILNPYRTSLPYESWHAVADSAMMNSLRPIIALKAGSRFQVFNLESRVLLHQYRFQETICFWTWISPDAIAVVTETAVYHWCLFKEETCPELLFKRHSRLAYFEIVQYKTDKSFRWFALTGLLPEDDFIQGVTQLYSVDYNISQCIEAHAVSFAEYHFEGNKSASTLLCAAVRHESQSFGKVHTVELGPYTAGNLALTNHYDTITFKEESDKYDFPVALQVSVHYGLIYVITKYGQLYVCDLETSACLFCEQVSPDVLFAATLDTSNQGMIGVNRMGQVLSIDLKTSRLVSFVRDSLKKPREAGRLESILRKDGICIENDHLIDLE